MSYAHAAALPGIQFPKPLSGHLHLRPGHDGRQTCASLRSTPAVWAGGNRPRHGWVSRGVVAESVLGTLQECGPPFHSSLPCQIQLSARCLAHGPVLGGCAESGTGLVSGSVSQCLYLSLLSLVSSLSISLTLNLYFSISVHLSHCPSLFYSVSTSVHVCFLSLALFSVCLFLSASLPRCLYLNLPVRPCLPASVAVVGLSVSLSLSRNLVTGKGCGAGH